MIISLLSLLLPVLSTPISVAEWCACYDTDGNGTVDLRDFAGFQNQDHVDSGYLGSYTAFYEWFAGPGCNAFYSRFAGRQLTVYLDGRIYEVNLRGVR